MSSVRRFQSRNVTPNLAPLVDVVMVILIFFMLGTSFAVSEGLLPTRLATEGETGAAPPAFAPAVRIALSQETSDDRCRISVMGQPLPDGSFNALQSYLRSKRAQGADPRGRLIIAASPTVRYQSVIAALDACVRAGFKNVQFAVGGGAGAGTPPAGR